MKYTEAILANSTRKLLWFEITKMLIEVSGKNFIMSFIVFFGTLSFPMRELIGKYWGFNKKLWKCRVKIL